MATQQTSDRANEDDDLTQVTMVPGEICLVVEDAHFRRRHYPGPSDLERHAQTVYDGVLAHMNRVVRDMRVPAPLDAVATLSAASVDPMGRSPLERDLTPGSGFSDYFRLDTLDIFRPRPARPATASPWVLLPRAKSLVMLAFYAVGPAALEPDAAGDRGGDWARQRALPIHQIRTESW